MEKKVGIITDCLCDLPRHVLEKYDITTVFFYVNTDRGKFMDTEEITAENVFEYVRETGKIPTTSEPAPAIFRKKLEKELKKYDDVIYVAIGKEVSKGVEAASQVVSEMGEEGRRVHIFDSGQLSTGQGHLVLRAAELAADGKNADEVLSRLEELKSKVSTSFIVENADYLYYNRKLPKSVKRACDMLLVHPVLVMKNGRISLKTILFGRYDKACRKYVNRTLRNPDRIDGKRIFITHAGCSTKMIQWVRLEVENRCSCEKVLVTNASATVSSNCGPNTFGIIFTQK